jgi:putative two-component system response regulator
MQILIVDDDDFTLSVLDNTLARMGHSVVTAHDGVEGMDILSQGEIRVVITDWDMPNMNGLDLCRTVRRADLSGYVYVIMLTGREGAKQRMEGLCAGADDFLNKPLDPEELLVCLKTAERILSLETRDVALFALAKLVESRDAETGAHLERVQSYSRLVAQNLSPEIKALNGVDDEYIRLLRQTSALHDLGKIGIPDAILLKPGKLTPNEITIMRTHTILGAQTLDAALRRFPHARFLQMAEQIAATHHEKFDGSGYPRGLCGEQIPLCGRIVAIADVYDALTSRRVYKDADTHHQAMDIIAKERGRHFDPDVVDAFKRAEPQILEAKERLNNLTTSAAAELAALPAPPVETPSPAVRKILVVEDDSLVRAKLVELLTAAGQAVIQARDGAEGMTMFLEHRPRVIISDWVMPKIDGVQFCRQIRMRSADAQAHFIMLTANTQKGQLLEAFEAGVDDFIGKPFDQEEFLARVRAGIRSAALEDELIHNASGSQALNAQLAVMNSRLERLSITDELTGLFNRRQAMIKLDEQWALSSRFPKPVTVAMLDIDHFKKVNDTYGHDAGDEVLRRLAGILRDNTRGTDMLCRVGGEEFLIIFPLQTMQEARVCAERCRQATQNHVFGVGNQSIKVTISIGLANRTRQILKQADLIKAADEALYVAKRNGRNRVEMVDDMESSVQAEQPLMQEPLKPNSALDMAAVLKRCGGDAGFASAVTERFRNSSTQEFHKIEQALNQADAPTVQRIAHTLKSMAAYVSADRASELARRIEDLGKANELAQVAPVLAQLGQEIEQVNQWIIVQNTPKPALA